MSETTRNTLQVDIVSDVVCPWCIIGYKQLQKALTLLSDPPVIKLRWQPFELNPAMPEEGQDLREHLAQKYGISPEQSAATRTRMTELGDALGFEFDYFDGMRMVNTFRAHQLLHWAEEAGCQTPLKLALFKAFFSDRQDVNDTAVLCAAAENVGLSSQQAAAVLEEQRFAAVVRKEQQQWLDREVHAVPNFVFNGTYQVPGAQEADTFVRVIEKIHSRDVA